MFNNDNNSSNSFDLADIQKMIFPFLMDDDDDEDDNDDIPATPFDFMKMPFMNMQKMFPLCANFFDDNKKEKPFKPEFDLTKVMDMASNLMNQQSENPIFNSISQDMLTRLLSIDSTPEQLAKLQKTLDYFFEHVDKEK